MTGANFCRALCVANGIEVSIVHGPSNHYIHGERMIVLAPHVFGGSSAKNLTLAAHEAGHAAQESVYGWAAPALRWLLLGRLLLEWDASRRARAMMIAAGRNPREETLRASWRAYLTAAVWQLVLLLAVLAFSIRKL